MAMAGEMHIKIVPDADPDAKGHWITVERKTERFLGWKATVELYSSCIPKGYHAISFARDPKNKW